MAEGDDKVLVGLLQSKGPLKKPELRAFVPDWDDERFQYTISRILLVTCEASVDEDWQLYIPKPRVER